MIDIISHMTHDLNIYIFYLKLQLKVKNKIKNKILLQN